MQKIGLILRFMRCFHVIIYSFTISCGLIVKIACIEFSACGGCSYIGAVLRSSWSILAPLRGI